MGWKIPSAGEVALSAAVSSYSPDSLTFLNSWGSSWGNEGSFSIEDHTVLELDKYPVRFYDVMWFEKDLTEEELQAYSDKVDEELRCHATQSPSVLELEARCPNCKNNVALVEFQGSVRRVKCPHCTYSFKLEASHLMETL